MKKWVLMHPHGNGQVVTELLTVLLKNRGIENGEIEEFLTPRLKNINLKNLNIDLQNLAKFKDIIKNAISEKKSIVVYTDYDVDGIASGAIIWETLYKMKAKVVPYVPDRVKEGYGLSLQGISYIKNKYQVDLLITVDHGITASQQIAYAKKLGINTVIIDHHLKPQKLPQAQALIHSNQLCATAISWIVAQYLKSHSPSSHNLKVTTLADLDLVALATIADLIPLKGINRSFVYYGMGELNKTKRIGLDALINECGLEKGKIGTFDISHILCPRINAAGRLMHALDALRLLCTKDIIRANQLASKLSLINRERQFKTIKETNDAQNIAEKLVKRKDKILIIESPLFTEGVIGLIAGRLVDKYHLPAIVISVGEQISKASARSIKNINIVSLIAKADKLLLDLGGHPMAAGFTINTKNIAAFKQQLLSAAFENYSDKSYQQDLYIDTELKLDDITNDVYQDIQKLSPFGIGNSEPIFVSKNLLITNIRRVGKDGKHLKIALKKSTLPISIEAIGFGMGEEIKRLAIGQFLDLVYKIKINNWNSIASLQLALVDVKITDSTPP